MRRKSKKGKAAKQARKAQKNVVDQEQDYTKAPHSFVFQRGAVGKSVKSLITDIRQIMEPYTASRLKIRRKNVMKDFITIAGTLNVSHFIVLTKTEQAAYMKLICVPKGPTLTFKINEYCLSRDVLSSQRHPDLDKKLFANHAVMVTNIPSDSMEHRLINVTFKNMFPSINPNTVRLNNMRRSVLMNYDPANNTYDLRHYTMRMVPTGLSRGMNKLMKSKSKLPNLGDRKDISDLFLDKGGLSDSEGELDGPHNQVLVPQKVKDRGVRPNSVNAIRLKEVGPRLNLSLVKIEEGFEGGNVLFHAYVKKTPEELELAKEMRLEQKKLKLARKQKQEADVERKKRAKEEQVKKSREGMERKSKQMKANGKTESGDEDEDTDDDGGEDDVEEEEDDDAEYYREEVGEEPEPEMFSQNKQKRKAPRDNKGPGAKRAKTSFRNDNAKSSPGGKKQDKTHKFSVKFGGSPQKAMKGKVLKGKKGGKAFDAEKKGTKGSFRPRFKR